MMRSYTTTTGEQMTLPEAPPRAAPPPSIVALETALAETEQALDDNQIERAALRERRRQLRHDLRAAQDRAAFQAFQRRQEMH